MASKNGENNRAGGDALVTQQSNSHPQPEGAYAPHERGSKTDLKKEAKPFRRAKQAILALTGCMMLVCAGMVITSALDDMAIARDRGYATAEVVDVGALRTTVMFRDDAGNYYQPNDGLKYPTGLERGQKVRVEYEVSHPDNVKVAGRSWTLAFLPALSSMAVALLIGALLLALVLWLEKRQK
ncbi:DUF3592 domain-containing protein [Corynebacterium anserum]